MNMVVLAVILASGIGGIFAMQAAIRNGANASIDHPTTWVRYWYRYLVFGAAFFLSFMLSPVLVALLPEVDLRQAPEWMQSASLIGSTLPGAILIYWGLARTSRWTDSRVRGQ
jgi:hypothetical protein